MKACILAGGEGRRLRPLTSHLPKPMVPLLGKPLLHRIVKQLRAEGIRDMALTLMYLPDVIRDFLGDGSAYDASFFYAVEKEPMGTAGGVRACADFLRGDDCLVISGDAVFYLMSRGLSEEDARALIVSGFADNVSKELPVEYAVEMNNLIRLEMKGSIG